jgi:hypothetical protein
LVASQRIDAALADKDRPDARPDDELDDDIPNENDAEYQKLIHMSEQADLRSLVLACATYLAQRTEDRQFRRRRLIRLITGLPTQPDRDETLRVIGTLMRDGQINKTPGRLLELSERND